MYCNYATYKTTRYSRCPVIKNTTHYFNKISSFILSFMIFQFFKIIIFITFYNHNFTSNRFRKKNKLSRWTSQLFIKNYLFFLAILPHKEVSGLFVFVLPPCGWSTGFIATPLTLDLNPFLKLLPNLPTTVL